MWPEGRHMSSTLMSRHVGATMSLEASSPIIPELHDMGLLLTMRFGSTAKVLAECKLKYYRISECCWKEGQGRFTHPWQPARLIGWNSVWVGQCDISAMTSCQGRL